MHFVVPILIATVIFAILGVVGTFVVPGPDKSLHRILVWTAVSCFWLMWFCTYAVQINPLGEPIMKAAEH